MVKMKMQHFQGKKKHNNRLNFWQKSVNTFTPKGFSETEHFIYLTLPNI